MHGLRYVNHLGKELDLSKGWLVQEGNTLHDWEARYTTLNGRTAGFYNESVAKSLPIILAAPSGADGLAKRDELYSITQADVDALSPGRLYLGDWYLVGYVVASSKSLYQYTDRVCSYDLTFLADSPLWNRDTTHVLMPGRGESDGLDYAFDYAFDYAEESYEQSIVNESVHDADAVIVFYGPVENPRLRIGDNVYGVNAEIGQSERFVIDTAAKTIVKVNAIGETSSAFSSYYGTLRKGSGSYAFEPIRTGEHVLSWDGSYALDITVRERQRERRWS